MKNKKMLYILLPLVLFVWGLIFYKVYNSINSSNQIVSEPPATTNLNDSNLYKMDTFSIFNNYRDPYLTKAVSVVKGNSHTINKPIPDKSIQVHTEVKWPSIIYNGVIKSKKSLKKLVLLKINGESNFMSTGTSSMGVEILDIYNDSIKVNYKGEFKVIKK